MDSRRLFNDINSLKALVSSESNGNVTIDSKGNIILSPDGGDILPDVDNVRDFGSPSKRWRNIYTGDLHLKNERGDWTIVEEKECLCVINNATGKKYKMVLQEYEEE